jgi:urea transport system ATP-binding protein
LEIKARAQSIIAGEARAVLTVEEVHVYSGASHALRGVSLEARKGRVTCVLGRNGVGKSSLLRAILGLEGVRSGRIVWEDQALDGKPR